jgi:hypothetical protein
MATERDEIGVCHHSSAACPGGFYGWPVLHLNHQDPRHKESIRVLEQSHVPECSWAHSVRSTYVFIPVTNPSIQRRHLRRVPRFMEPRGNCYKVVRAPFDKSTNKTREYEDFD